MKNSKFSVSKKTLALLLAFSMFLGVIPAINNRVADVFANAAETNGNNGFISQIEQIPNDVDAADIVHITTADGLMDLESGKYYVLDNDIDLQGVNWTMPTLRGTVDGRGYTIKNLHINSSSQWAGLFSTSYDGTLKNLAVETASGGINLNASFDKRIGGLVASCESGTTVIDNCYFIGNISGSSSNGIVSSGGLVGGVNNNSLNIINSYYSGVMNIPSSQSNIRVGGLVGDTTGTCVITGSYSIGSITASGSSYIKAGGIAGEFTSMRVTGSYSEMDITATGTSNNATDVGGILGGGTNASVIGCHYVGTVNATNKNRANIGGIIGLCGWNAQSVTIKESYVISNQTASSANNAAMTGGIIGWASVTDLEIEQCYYKGNSTAFSANLTSESSYAVMGGIIGWLDSNNSSTSIEDCHSTGNKTGSGYWQAIGGLVGFNGSGVGLIVTNCYASGNLISDDNAPYSNIYGLIDLSNGSTINNSYFNSDCQITARGFQSEMENVNGRTAVQMRDIDIYPAFDFAGTWSLSSGINDGFPYLQNLFASYLSGTDNVGELEVLLPADYTGYLLRLGASNGETYSLYVDNQTMTFQALDSAPTYKIELVSPLGLVYGEIDGINITGTTTVEFTDIPAPKNVYVTVKANGATINEGFGVSWYDSLESVSNTAQLNGTLIGEQYSILIALDETLGVLYAEPATRQVTIGVEDEIIINLVPLEKTTISGSVTDKVTGTSIESATVKIRQILNGYSVNFEAETDAAGKFSIEVFNAPANFTASKTGYVTAYSESGDIKLVPLPQNLVTLNVTKVFTSGATETVSSFNNLQITAYNETKSADLTVGTEFPYILFNKAEISPSDTITITISDKTAKFAQSSKGFTLDGYLNGNVQLSLTELGGIEITALSSVNAKNTAILFDSSGNYVSHMTTGLGLAFAFYNLPDGNYTVALLGYSPTIDRAASLTYLSESGVEYVSKDVTVSKGTISPLTYDEIPAAIEAATDSSLTVSNTRPAAGSLVTVKAVAKTGMLIEIPAGVEFVANSVTIDGKSYSTNYTYNSGKLTVPGGGVVRFCVKPVGTGEFVISGLLTGEGEAARPFGSASFYVPELEINAANVTGQDFVWVSGFAPASGDVDIYLNGIVNTTVTANKLGQYTACVQLSNTKDYMVHTVYASVTVSGKTLSSPVINVTYNANYPNVSKVTMITQAHGLKVNDPPIENISVFDFANSQSTTPYYAFDPNYPTITFIVEFDDGAKDKLNNVFVVTEGPNGERLGFEAVYTTIQGKDAYVATADFNSFTAPVYVGVDFVANTTYETTLMAEQLTYRNNNNDDKDDDDEEQESDLIQSLLAIQDDEEFLDALADALADAYEKLYDEITESLDLIDLLPEFEDIATGLDIITEEGTCEGYAESEVEDMGFVKMGVDDGSYVYVISTNEETIFLDFEADISMRLSAVPQQELLQPSSLSIGPQRTWIDATHDAFKLSYELLLSAYDTAQLMLNGIKLNLIELEAAREELGGLYGVLKNRFPEMLAGGTDAALNDLLQRGNKLSNVINKIKEKLPESIKSFDDLTNNVVVKSLETIGKVFSGIDLLITTLDATEHYLNEYTNARTELDDYYNRLKNCCSATCNKCFARPSADNEYKQLYEKWENAEVVYFSAALVQAKSALVQVVSLKAILSGLQKTPLKGRIISLASKAPLLAVIEVAIADIGLIAKHVKDICNARSFNAWVNASDNAANTLKYCKIECKEPQEPENKKKANLSQDPSGYVYEAVESNRLEGVTATAYNEEDDGLLWNAEEYGQQNPLITDANGAYAWDVPLGNWKVLYEKSGYETLDSFDVFDWLPVPPPQTEVNVGLVDKAAPTIQTVNGYEDYIEIVFSKYMKTDLLTSDNIILDGVEYSIEFVNEEEDPNPENAEQTYASRIRLIPDDGKFEVDGDVSLTIDSAVKSYAGTGLGSTYESNVKITVEPKEIAVLGSIGVNYGSEHKISVQVLPAEAGKNLNLTAVSSSNTILLLEASSVQTDSNGYAEFTVAGELPGVVSLVFSLPDSGLSAHSTITVSLPGEDIEKSNDAALASLAVSSGSLTPVFNPNTNSYSVSVSYNTGSINVSATANHAGAAVSGTGYYNLNVGANTISVKVTAADKITTKTYTIVVTRAESAPGGDIGEANDATLASLTVSSGNLTPSFNPNTNNYSASVSYDVDSINVMAAPNYAGATVSGTGYYNLNIGANSISINVIAADKITTKTYTIIVTRANSTPTPPLWAGAAQVHQRQILRNLVKMKMQVKKHI